MHEILLDQYRQYLSRYSADLLQGVCEQASRFSRAKRLDDPVEQLIKTLGNEKALAKMLDRHGEGGTRAVAVLRRSPFVPWRWDHAIAVLESVGVESPYTLLLEFLEMGILAMKRNTTDDPIVRFDVVTGASPASLPLVTLAGPIVSQTFSSFEIESPLPSEKPAGSFRQADGWEWPMRLAILWQMTWLAPIKRTQQRLLFKKDRERLTLNPLLAAETLDSLVRVPDPGLMIYQLALDQGWLDPVVEEQSPTAPLWQVWPDDLAALSRIIGRGLVTLEDWNELGTDVPVGTFSSDVVVSRQLILLWLSLLPAEEGATLESLARALESSVAPWNGAGEPTGPMRLPAERATLCRTWVRGFVLGLLYQAGLVEAADLQETSPIVRLTPRGKQFVGIAENIEPAPKYPVSLLVQPNHQLIVYRQALSIELLVQLILFAEPRSSGAAMTLELTPGSIYHGLEAGLQPEQIIQLLQDQSGRTLPGGVEESIRTWSQKRERLTIYSQATLFEFASAADLEDALARGLVAARLTDRMVLVEEQEGAFKNLRLTASRDYRLEPQPCVQCSPDGTILKVNLETSDLMLESEIRRISDLASTADKQGAFHFRVTRESIERAFEQGLRGEFIDQWFRRRTGQDPPDSVRLLLRAVTGLSLSARQIVVVSAESPLVADGLLQHPRTASLFAERLGPSALSIATEKLPELRQALDELGIPLTLPEANAG
ncbi:helicase-associated domain-containing protein [bacterium]|nr:helicase-associated domain-containing protein [bacterium]